MLAVGEIENIGLAYDSKQNNPRPRGCYGQQSSTLPLYDRKSPIGLNLGSSLFRVRVYSRGSEWILPTTVSRH